MANPHFGEIGDLWKHLVLGDLLDRSRPARYWETHAGSGTYTLDRTWEREYGVFTLLREAFRAPAIEASRYAWLLRTLPPGDDGEPRYPGSARLAMEVLGDTATYVLCDLDTASVADLTRSARELDHSDLVRVEHADGLATISEISRGMPGEQADATFVVIDPFDPTQRSADGIDALDLFTALAAAGFRTMLWLADEAADGASIVERAADDGVEPVCSLGIETALARGETSLNPGVERCAVVLANQPTDDAGHAERLGRQLAALYDEALMPDGTPGALAFTRTDVG
jgi:23S rRNA (adenine2030-N6)-methyltransferase